MSVTVAQMRALLGLGAEFTDAYVVNAYAEYQQAGGGDGSDVELIPLSLVKAHLRLTDDETTQDDIIRHYLAMAIATLDGPNGWLGRALIERTYVQTFPSFDDVARPPYPPLVTVTGVEQRDNGGAWLPIEAALWDVADGGLLRATVTSSSAPFLQGSAPSSSSASSGAYKAIPGAQLQAMGLFSRATANGGQRAYLNTDAVDYAQVSTSVTGYLGGVIGATAAASNGVTASVNNAFDLYELAIWRGELTNAQADAIMAATVANYAIAQLDTNLLLEGDSITDGIPTSLGTNPAYHGAVATWLTNPGAMMVPANVRVISIGTSGSQTSGAVTRRDATNAVAGAVYPGGAVRNVMVVQLGRNDFSQSGGQKNSATFYADMVALLNTAGNGYLQRGWKCIVAANIAQTTQTVTTNVSPSTENTLQKRVEGFRAKITDEATRTVQAQFRTDTLSASGQTYDGLVGVLHLYAISQGGNAWFYDAVATSDWAPAGPYDNDSTHLVSEGHALMASGGDTPQYGYRAAVA